MSEEVAVSALNVDLALAKADCYGHQDASIPELVTYIRRCPQCRRWPQPRARLRRPAREQRAGACFSWREARAVRRGVRRAPRGRSSVLARFYFVPPFDLMPSWRGRSPERRVVDAILGAWHA